MLSILKMAPKLQFGSHGEAWYVCLAKVAFDQTVWALTWNSLYYVALGALLCHSPLQSCRSGLQISY